MTTFSTPIDERRRILQMVEDGRMSAAEAIELLENLTADGIMPGVANPQASQEDVVTPAWDEPQTASNGGPRWLRVRVTDLHSGRKKVSVNIPFRLADWGLRLGARFSPEVGDINLNELAQMLHADGAQGKLVDVMDDEDGEHVEIFIE